MDHPEDSVCFEELQPFVRRIAHQQGQLAEKLTDLAAQRDRIASITSDMARGARLRRCLGRGGHGQ